MKVKRPHMVSRGYLEGWADPKGIVEVIDVSGRRGLRMPIGNATVVNYVYEPEVMTASDLEADYARIESDGIPVIVKLRDDSLNVTPAEIAAMIAFLDMHLHRGRFADQAKVRTPALLWKLGGQIEEAELSLGDRLLMSQWLPDTLKLSTLGLDQWPWKIRREERLPTGDGAVIVWAPSKGADIAAVSFPLSDTRLLVIGDDLPDDVPVVPRIIDNCKRWIIGAPGTLNLNWADIADDQ